MKLGAFDPLFRSIDLESTLNEFKSLGLEAVEVSTGGYVGNSHCDPARLLDDTMARRAFTSAFESRELTISALSCHGNALHPDQEQAQRFHGEWRSTVLLAEKLGLDTVVTFSGCPGGGPEDRTPNWVTCAWPTDHSTALDWQWEERVIPYWREESAFAEAHGVRVAIEMHPGFVVYHPENMMRLRAAVGKNLGTNFDPSHLFWQGVDVVAAIRHIGEAIFHFHAKDTHIDGVNTSIKGVLDTTPYVDVARRSWVFRTVGYGHGELTWRQIISALRTVGYDGAVSIEHEDALASNREGLAKAVSVLRSVILSEPVGKPWWTS